MVIFILYIRNNELKRQYKDYISLSYDNQLQWIIYCKGILKNTRKVGIIFLNEELVIKKQEKIITSHYANWIDKTQKLKIE